MVYQDLAFDNEIFENKILKIQFWGLRILGYIVCKRDSFKNVHLIRGAVNFGVLSTGLVFGIIFITGYRPGIKEATMALAVFIVYSNILIKTVFFCFYSKEYSELINHVQKEMKRLETQLLQLNKRLFRLFVNDSRRVNNIIAGLVCVSGVCTIAEGVGFSLFHHSDVKQKSFGGNISLPLIYIMVPSWVVSENFILVHVLPCYMEFLGGLGVFLWTTFNISFMRYAAFRLDLINCRLQHLTDSGARQIKTVIVDCVKEVIFVKEFIEKYERVSKFALFAECTSNTTLMCMLMYQVSQVKEYANAVVILPAILGLFGMLYAYYWNANEISWASDQICTSIYMSNWYELPVALQKDMLIFMKGCTNSLSLTAVLFTMNTSTFVMTLKTSYSYFTLLTNLADSN